MQLPSLSLLIVGLFIAYISHSLWTLYSLFVPKPCPLNARCIPSYLTKPRSLQLWVYTSQYASAKAESSMSLVWKSEEFFANDEFENEVNVTIPRKTRQNGTLHVHSFVTLEGRSPFSAPWMVHMNGLLTTYMTPQAETFQLMSGEESNEKKSKKPVSKEKPISHWRSELVLSIMADDVSLNAHEIPSELFQFLQNYQGEYLPILYIDNIALRTKHLMPINDTCHELPLKISYRPISFGKLRMWLNMEMSIKMLHGLGFTEKDTDEVKGIFGDMSSLHFLFLTFLVAAFHILFDFLAFKNDISYWRNRDSMVGLSSRTVLWRCLSTIIIFLYLLDEDTSLLVLIPAGIGSVIELWKVTKAFKVTVMWHGWKPSFVLGAQSDQEKETQSIDSEAMKLLSYLLYPLCIGGAIYSLIYTPHKSWYSWCVQSMVNGVYAFGFLFMLPQLFVNYKLKSVAHLPWRAFMYKAFNTFIDDVFAFIITMPTAHRLACFRDDIIFVVYLYQRWLYPVDKSRVNEYGQSFEEDKESKKKK